MVTALENEGVGYIFAIPGEDNLDVLEMLRRSKIRAGVDAANGSRVGKAF